MPRIPKRSCRKLPHSTDLAGVAGAHHERLDGKGYPHGLAGDQIVLETRIITTADIFDALTAERPYRAAMPVTKALGDHVRHGRHRRSMPTASPRCAAASAAPT